MLDFKNDVLPYKNELYRIALRITLSAVEAEDIVQETFLRMWKMRDALEKVNSVEAFCITTCRNLALDHIEKKCNQNTSLDAAFDSTPDTASTPLQMLDRQDRKAWVVKLFNELPEKSRTVVQLRDIEGKSYKEISQLMSITEEQVKVTLFRARRHIKEEFEKIDRHGL